MLAATMLVSMVSLWLLERPIQLRNSWMRGQPAPYPESGETCVDQGSFGDGQACEATAGSSRAMR